VLGNNQIYGHGTDIYWKTTSMSMRQFYLLYHVYIIHKSRLCSTQIFITVLPKPYVKVAKEIHEVLPQPTYPITRSESDISSVR
jgi:hypothetical protein